MKTKYLLLLLLVPAFFIAANMPVTGQGDESDDQQLPCSQYGSVEAVFNGNHGCPYSFDFNSLITGSCTLADIDLDRNTSGIQHRKETFSCITWTDGSDGIIHMSPKSGYGGQGFTVSNDVYVHFTNNTSEAPTWTMYINYYAGPYPAPCY